MCGKITGTANTDITINDTTANNLGLLTSTSFSEALLDCISTKNHWICTDLNELVQQSKSVI